MLTRCYRYALLPSAVQEEAFGRANRGARRYWNALVAAQRYAEREIAAGRMATIVGKLTGLLQAKELTGRAVSIAIKRAAESGTTPEAAIQILRTEKAAELGQVVRAKDGSALRWIGRRRMATQYALERVEATRKKKGSGLATAVAYALAKKFRECCDPYIRGKRRRPKFKRFGDPVSLQAQILKTTPNPLIGDFADLARIAGPVANRVAVILHRPLPQGARIKQLSLTSRGSRYYIVLMIEFEAPPRAYPTGQQSGLL